MTNQPHCQLVALTVFVLLQACTDEAPKPVSIFRDPQLYAADNKAISNWPETVGICGDSDLSEADFNRSDSRIPDIMLSKYSVPSKKIFWTIDRSHGVTMTWAEVQAVFADALAQWQPSTLKEFIYVENITGQTIDGALMTVRFHAREEMDGGFDGAAGSIVNGVPKNILAHAHLPKDNMNLEVHFDRDEPWSKDNGQKEDFFAVAMHEIGHALGLGHSGNPGAVMYCARVKGRRRPSGPDEDGMRRLYPPQEALPSPAQ